MNGHHADCSCQSCTIGREIGFGEALVLMRELYESHLDLYDRRTNDTMARSRDSMAKVNAFLAEHE